MVHLNLDKSFEMKAGRRKESDRYRRMGCWFWGKFTEFCKRTDLHGYKYIVMEELQPLERCCWGIAVLASIITAIFFVVNAYQWYARNPIVTVIESTQGAIWDVPFPAVTICDLNVVSRQAARTLANTLKLPSNVSADFVFEVLRLAPLLHSSLGVNINQKENLRTLQTILDVNNMSIDKLFVELSPAKTCSQLLHRCMWKNVIYQCDQLFHEIFTAMHLCCAFNYFAVKPQEKNQMLDRVPMTPRRVASCGYQTALSVLLKTNAEDYYSAVVASEGFLVFIDDAYNFPNLDSPVRLVNPSTEVLIALSPETTYATSGIRNFSPDKRQCYYYDEMQFGVFQKYSFHNCIAYQKMEVIKNACDCVPFFFPMQEYFRLCNFNDLDCLENILNPLDGQISYSSFESTLQCLPECEHFDYPLEVALGTLTNNLQHNALPFFNDVDLQNKSLLNIFFNDLVSTKYRRDVYLNWQNILAAFGGLLSLLLGFTLISGFDFLLFLALRVVYDGLVTLQSYRQPNKHNNKINTSHIVKVQEHNSSVRFRIDNCHDENMGKPQLRW